MNEPAPREAEERKPDVTVARCASYDPDTVRAALEECLRPLGGLDWVRPGMRIALKANLVARRKPEAAATTHPEVLAALTRMLREKGAAVVLGDSPGSFFNAATLNGVYDGTGMRRVEQAGAKLNDNFGQKNANYPEALVAKEFLYTAWLDDADAIINVCKLKTHGMMGLSAATKNMFGAVPGTNKPEYHFRYPNQEDFARMLLDLNTYLKPRLCVVDAVVGMEGNGPTAGTPRQIGALLAGEKPWAVDLACVRLINLEPKEVPTLRVEQACGLIPETAEQLDVEGPLEELCVADYEKILGKSMFFTDIGGGGPVGKAVGRFVRWALDAVPSVNGRECIGCAHCEQICPAQAITMKNKRPVIRRKQCIHCFCCQEFCPKGAMKVKRALIARIVNR